MWFCDQWCGIFPYVHGVFSAGSQKASVGATIGLAVLLLLSVLARGVRLEADPPDTLSFGSLAIYTDEGYKTFHARNQVLFGKPLWHPADEYRLWLRQSPTSVWLHTAWFRLTNGVDIPRARSLHILCGALTLWLFYLVVRREVGSSRALLASGLWGFSFVGIMFGRMAFLENFLACVSMVVLWLLFKRPLRAHGIVLALLFGALGITLKPSFVFFLLAAGAGVLLTRWRHEYLPNRVPSHRQASQLRSLAIGLLVVPIGVYLLLRWLPGAIGSFLPIPGRDAIAAPAGVAQNLFYNQFAFRLPVPLFFAWMGAVMAMSQFFDAQAKPRWLSSVCSFWLLVGFFLLLIFDGTGGRIRYHLFLLPAVCVLAAEFLMSMWEQRLGPPQPNGERHSWIRRVAVGIAAAPLAAAVFLGFFFVLGNRDKDLLDQGLVLLDSLRHFTFPLGAGHLWVALLCTLGLWGLTSYCRAGRATPYPYLLLFLLAGSGDLVYYARWVLNPSYALQSARRDLADRLPKGAVVAGTWAPALTLGTPLKSLYLHCDINIKGGRLRRLSPSHLLLADDRPEESELIRQLYPGLLTTERLLTTYRISSHTQRLFRVDWSIDSPAR